MAALMIQGCGSDVGKSVLVAGLCRVFADRGLTVRPFKPQNMSNNAAVTADGGELGRAQALQALACRTAPTVQMNPVLLKPQSDSDAQLVVLGKVAGSFAARSHGLSKRDLLEIVLASFRQLEAESDLVLVEGAGSPAETNLRANDIANMGFAGPAQVPVVLVGDIDRGHVIAQLVGAHAVLEAADRARIKGFIVNKFRGDPTLFEAGRRDIAGRTGWRDFGMVPWMHEAALLPAEDAVVLQTRRGPVSGRKVKIVVPMLSRIANFDDFDPLRAEPEVDFAFVPPGCALPGDAELVILPGTKATIADLAFLRAQGWDIDIAAHVRRGGRVLGICGGYQMLGRIVADPCGIEGEAGKTAGLGLLDIETTLLPDKILLPASGRLAEDGARFAGYEIHAGRTTGPGTESPLLLFDSGTPDGARTPDGRIAGCYVHGLFNQWDARRAVLEQFGVRSTPLDHDVAVDRALAGIAGILSCFLNVDGLLGLARAAG